MTSGQKKREAYPAPKVISVIPRGGAAQTPHDHVVAVVLLWVLDGHILKDMTIGTHNIVRPGPHIPPLFHHRPRSLISIPRYPLREKFAEMSSSPTVAISTAIYSSSHRPPILSRSTLRSPKKIRSAPLGHSTIAASTYLIVVLSNGTS